MTQDNIVWLDYNNAPEQRDDLAADTETLRAALLDRLESVLHYCCGPAIAFGQAIMRVPALQGACINACHVANLLESRPGIAGVRNVLGQIAAIFEGDHASSPLL